MKTSIKKYFKLFKNIPDLCLQFKTKENMYLITLDGLLSFVVGLIGMIKSNLKFINVSLQLFFDPQSLRF